MQQVRVRLLSSQKKSRALTHSRAESSILTYQRKRIQSRTQKSRISNLVPVVKDTKASEYALIFQADEDIFRKSLAFTHGRQLTPRPYKGVVNGLIRSYLRRKDYEKAKREDVKHQRYISSYSIPRRVESCKLQF